MVLYGVENGCFCVFLGGVENECFLVFLEVFEVFEVLVSFGWVEGSLSGHCE